MAGSLSGVQAQFPNIQRKTIWTHCACHKLNLIISHSCKIPEIRNVLGVMKEFTKWMKYSAKRTELLNLVY